MTRREMMQYAAALGGAIVLGSETKAAPVPGAPAPLPGWSCEFKLHRAEATSLILNGELWCRHIEKELGRTWVLQEGEVIVPLPESLRYQKELNILAVSSPWGEESLVHVCWNGVLKKKMEFGKYEEKQLTH